MEKSVKRDFNVVAALLLVFSFIRIAIQIFTDINKIDLSGLFGYNVDSLYLEIFINALILIAIIFTFLKKRAGLVLLTLLFIIRMFATINWSGHPSISTQLGGNFAFFIRDFGLFAIAMCFKKNGISGWKSMLASEEELANLYDEDDTIDETPDEQDNASSAISDNITNDSTPKYEQETSKPTTEDFAIFTNKEENVAETPNEQDNDSSAISPIVTDNSTPQYVEEAPVIKEDNHVKDNVSEEKKEDKKETSVPVKRVITFANKKKIGIAFLIGVIALILVLVGIVTLKSYPDYISSFGDKWKYTFNMSNNPLGRTLLDRVYCLRKNTYYLCDIPGYRPFVSDSALFFESREDIYRENSTAKMFIADKVLTDFNNIVSSNYYIIVPSEGKPYGGVGSRLSLINESLGEIPGTVYETREYDYEQSFDKELQLLDEAAQIPVSDINLIREIGNYYEHAGILTKAADYYRFALDHNGNNPEIRGMLAYVLALIGDNDEAREEAEKAIEKNDKEQKALSALALIEADESNWKEAKKYAKKAIDYGTDDSNVYYAYCEALYKQGDIKAAHNYYNKAFKLYRHNPRCEKYSEYAGCPFEVLKFHYGSFKGNTEIIPYDEKLIRNKCYFIVFKIDVNILRREDAKIGIKIYKNGQLEIGQPSRDGYTFFIDLKNKDIGEAIYEISGWGNDYGDAWTVGTHRIEIWYKDNKIAEDSFHVY